MLLCQVSRTQVKLFDSAYFWIDLHGKLLHTEPEPIDYNLIINIDIADDANGSVNCRLM